jgi:hypothetical protein
MKLFNNRTLALAGIATSASTLLLIPPTHAKLQTDGKDVFHITSEQKANIAEKLQPLMNKYFKIASKEERLAADDDVPQNAPKFNAFADVNHNKKRSSKISEQCLTDLTSTNSYANSMNFDLAGLLGFLDLEDFATKNDQPVWTTNLLLSLFYILELTPAPFPNGMCVTDKKGKLSCNSAILPLLAESFGLSNAFFTYYFEIPSDACLLGNGGAIVHTSFTTTCFTPFFPDYPAIEFVAIPQCAPTSCSTKEVRDFWRENIEADFEELGFDLDECRVKFKADTKMPTKKKTKARKSALRRAKKVMRL